MMINSQWNGLPVASLGSSSLRAHARTHSGETAGDRLMTQIQLRIPPQYADNPILSQLVNYGVEFNIRAALLSKHSEESGWFDLALLGQAEQIQQALEYLRCCNIDIWFLDMAQDSWDYL
ncbi:NIL domain-containing protein [Lyngbya confervoides]|uniref:NIL domain-containing protein n=1 Tax=Lyngbya confervoides BDU141951 TaxID=1574623 RepID=A0ABD4T0F3_9CYAN|nr:NIL domain-containing protein [Lyngbya confervoides]MCM1982085.1 NIL domain-containing protein [Lyngbya confervoides BDU141951]